MQDARRVRAVDRQRVARVVALAEQLARRTAAASEDTRRVTRVVGIAMEHAGRIRRTRHPQMARLRVTRTRYRAIPGRTGHGRVVDGDDLTRIAIARAVVARACARIAGDARVDRTIDRGISASVLGRVVTDSGLLYAHDLGIELACDERDREDGQPAHAASVSRAAAPVTPPVRARTCPNRGRRRRRPISEARCQRRRVSSGRLHPRRRGSGPRSRTV